ncbi:MAG: hypothetical protein ACQEXB_04710 [Bacillota bacterium]
MITQSKAIDKDRAEFFDFEDAEHFIREWAKVIQGGIDHIKETGFWVDESQPKAFTSYLEKTSYGISNPHIKIGDNGI